MVSCNQLPINEYVSEACSYVDKSIEINIKSAYDDFSTTYLIFHYKDSQISNIPEFKNHTFETLPQCRTEDDCDGYLVQFSSDDHDPIANGRLDLNRKTAVYEVTNRGFYCVYLDANANYKGTVSFENSFGELDIDNYTRLGFLSKVIIPLYVLLLLVVVLLRFPSRLKWFVGLVSLVSCIKVVSLLLISRFGVNFETWLFNLVFNNILNSLILGYIVLWILYHSVGFKVIEDESMIDKNIRISEYIVLSFVVLRILNGLYINLSLIPFYNLHFDSIRRFLLLLQNIPYVLIYVSAVFEFITLKKNFRIVDPRVIPSFSILTISPIVIVVLQTTLTMATIHRATPKFYDFYYKDPGVIALTVIPQLIIYISILCLCFIWRPRKYQRLGNPVEEAIELNEVNN